MGISRAFKMLRTSPGTSLSLLCNIVLRNSGHTQLRSCHNVIFFFLLIPAERINIQMLKSTTVAFICWIQEDNTCKICSVYIDNTWIPWISVCSDVNEPSVYFCLGSL